MRQINISNYPNLPSMFRTVSVKIQPHYETLKTEFKPVYIDVICKINNWRDVERTQLFDLRSDDVRLRIDNETIVDMRNGNYVDTTITDINDPNYVDPIFHIGELDFFFEQEGYSISTMVEIGVLRADAANRFDP